MEFHEKLQQLRKKHALTQEQLAQQLFVSRTAISKWESGRGYPNLESLKCLSRLFSVSIDELLSNDEWIAFAETETRSTLNKVSSFVFGILDMVPVILLFMPLFGQPEEGYVRSVTLFEYTALSPTLRILYILLCGILLAAGALEIIVGWIEHETGLRIYKPCSIALHTLTVLLFALSRQPYITSFLFLLFLIKTALLLREGQLR